HPGALAVVEHGPAVRGDRAAADQGVENGEVDEDVPVGVCGGQVVVDHFLTGELHGAAVLQHTRGQADVGERAVAAVIGGRQGGVLQAPAGFLVGDDDAAVRSHTLVRAGLL